MTYLTQCKFSEFILKVGKKSNPFSFVDMLIWESDQ